MKILAVKITTFIFIIFSFATLINAQVRSDFDRKMNQPFEPFNVIENIYYVGASDVASYLITTNKGHILIDSGFEETVPMIEANVEKLGFDLKDVKIILNNHSHSDHAGGLKLLKSKTGAKLYSVREQADSLEIGAKNDFRYGNKLSFSPVKVDKIIKHGQKVKLGNTKLKTHLTPGHTKGCTTFTTKIKHNRRKLNVIFLCSLSALDYNLIDNPKYLNHSQDFANSFNKLKRIKVDVFLGSHAQFFKMSKKVEMMKKDKSKNLFIDRKGYMDFVIRNEKAFQRKLTKQKEEREKNESES